MLRLIPGIFSKPLGKNRSNTIDDTATTAHSASVEVGSISENTYRSRGLKVNVNYVPPFDIIKSKLQFSSGADGISVSTSYNTLVDLIKLYLRGVRVDEEWYFSMYPDVKEAVEVGAYRSAAHHFVENGYFEGRLPFALLISEEWYLSDNEDIAEGIRKGEIDSALAHYRQHGYLEGRLPSDL